MGRKKRTRRSERLRVGVGLASIAAGLAAVVAPRRVGRALGVKGREARDGIFDFGLVQIAAGAGILHDPKSGGNLWITLGEEAFDLAALGAALLATKRRGRVAAAMAGVGALMLADIFAARRIAAS